MLYYLFRYLDKFDIPGAGLFNYHFLPVSHGHYYLTGHFHPVWKEDNPQAAEGPDRRNHT